jgi:hypothetical protein
MAPNKEAAFGLSFALALYPGKIDARYIDLAAQVFDTLEKQATDGLNG